jgi:acyl-CoA thioester hydrolase
MGVAHHASFVPWLEMARTEALRASGNTYAQMEASGVFLVVTKLEMAYRRPARYDDVLRIRCSASIAGRARLRHGYVVELAAPGDGQVERTGDQPLATAATELACVNGEGRPCPMPEWLVDVVRG